MPSFLINSIFIFKSVSPSTPPRQNYIINFCSNFSSVSFSGKSQKCNCVVETGTRHTYFGLHEIMIRMQWLLECYNDLFVKHRFDAVFEPHQKSTEWHIPFNYHTVCLYLLLTSGFCDVVSDIVWSASKWH